MGCIVLWAGQGQCAAIVGWALLASLEFLPKALEPVVSFPLRAAKMAPLQRSLPGLLQLRRLSWLLSSSPLFIPFTTLMTIKANTFINVLVNELCMVSSQGRDHVCDTGWCERYGVLIMCCAVL